MSSCDLLSKADSSSLRRNTGDRESPQQADSFGAGGAPHSPQSCGREGRPSGTNLLTVPLKNLLDELIHHLSQVLRRGQTGQRAASEKHCPDAD